METDDTPLTPETLNPSLAWLLELPGVAGTKTADYPEDEAACIGRVREALVDLAWLRRTALAAPPRRWTDEEIAAAKARAVAP